MIEIPFELVEKIVSTLPNNDKIQCLLVSKRWYTSLYRVLVHTVVIERRRQLKQFLQIITQYDDIVGPYVRQFYLKNRVGMTKEEFEILGIYCPHIEILKFREWRHYKKPALSQFKNIKQIPKIYDLIKGQTALQETGKTLTHLDLGARIVRDLVLQNWLIPFLCFGTNLTHLGLDGFYNPTTRVGQLEFNFVTWNLLHLLCKHLNSIEIHTMTLTATDPQAENMKKMVQENSVLIQPKLKNLILRNLSLDDPIWLTWLSRIYPNLTVLDMRFDLNAFVNFDETVQRLDRNVCQQTFIDMAHHLNNLHSLSLESIKSSHFPGKLFFDIFTEKQVRLEKLAIRYNTDIFLSRKGLDTGTLESIVNGQASSIKTLDIDMWTRSHEYFYEFLEPLSVCSRLVDLTLSSDDFGKFNFNPIPIDMILDQCVHLRGLRLARTALTINDKHTVHSIHPLKKLVITVARVSKQLFRYLGVRCPQITHLEICTSSWMPREMEMRIDMPNHKFEFLRISDLNKLNVPRLEGNLGSGTSVNIFAVTQFDRIYPQMERYRKKQCDCIPSFEDLACWYHLYEIDDGRLRYPPSALRKLRRAEVSSLQYLAKFYKENHQRDQMGSNGYMVDRYVSKKNWRDDVQYGFIHIKCKSIIRLQYNYNEIKWPKL
ncbi:hypothetical protein INT46_010090 [Mucor plumbeus]|uniref:F-box domain-containing protein n=1 Tax=Mucor plumbeus TaxID=97098 RepID=A0A8H7QV17_9FUNG|nr:hypothetical protein INT46_010090 [Mucor plumbeus]